MFRYEKDQKVFKIAGIKIGGQFGENPPVLIGNMFQKGDSLLESRKELRFNKKEAENRIREFEKISRETGISGLIAMVANSEEEIRCYIDFFISVTEMPFAIDIWQEKIRLAAARYIAQKGLQDRVLYNSITPWDEDIPSQVSELRELGIKHVVVQVFDVDDKMSSGRLKSLRRLLPLVEKGEFATILIDTAVMNLPATSFSLLANILIKNEFGLPVGFAPSNGSYLWRKSANEKERDKFKAMDSAIHALSVLASDFLLIGPLAGMKRAFTSVAVATTLMATFLYEEMKSLPAQDHPLNLLFPDVAKIFYDDLKGRQA